MWSYGEWHHGYSLVLAATVTAITAVLAYAIGRLDEIRDQLRRD
jgi:hypothetical protein